MKKHFYISATLALLLLPLLSYAQPDGRKPGIYAIVNGESIPLSSTYGSVSTVGENSAGLEIKYQTFKYKGESSGTITDSVFVLVIDPIKKEVTKRMSGYDPFVKNMTPEKTIIIPLEVISESQCRMYYPGAKYNRMILETNTRIDFEHSKISDNSYEIRTHKLPAGEYGFVFRTKGIEGFDFTAIFDFTIQ